MDKKKQDPKKVRDLLGAGAVNHIDHAELRNEERRYGSPEK